MLNAEKFINSGRVVVEEQLSAMQALASRINNDFEKVCQGLLDCQGCVIVMGRGKLSHVGKMIAGTLASTGTPAFFIHPGEANYGDAGMITVKDVIIVLCDTGESPELLLVLPLIKRLNVPLFTLIGNSHSTLAHAAKANLDVSVKKEAGILGLAPTCSTTVTLAMGDALAIALLQMRKNTSNQFATVARNEVINRNLLVTVKDIMLTGDAIPIVDEHALLKTALVEMTQKKLGMTTVLNQDKQLAGIFTDGDLRRAFDKDADVYQTVIKQVMSKNPKVLVSDMLAAEALHMMEKFKITALVVVDEQRKPVGVVHMHGILAAGVI